MYRRKFTQTAVVAPLLHLMAPHDVRADAPETMLETMPDYESIGCRLVQQSTPRGDGYYFPAEWQEHEFTIMVMPPPQNWKGSGIPLHRVRRQWANIANQLAEYEPVLMVVRPEDRREARRVLAGSIELIEFPINDGWSRDSGPMFVVDDHGSRRVAGFTFNGWGAKFPPYDDDAMLKARLCKHLDTALYPIDFVLEGGAVTLDGQGTLITTEQCLLHPKRNAKHDKKAVEQILHDALGTRKVIWLSKGLEPDPVTDGHVDGICAFVGPASVMLHTTRDRRDPNYPICQDAKRRLLASTDAQGRKLEVIEVPLDGELSHLNFSFANGAILVPVTGDPRQDDRPMGVMMDVFGEDYDVIGVEANVLAEGGGGIHCITQQVPRV